jgi:hypothetical protein
LTFNGQSALFCVYFFVRVFDCGLAGYFLSDSKPVRGFGFLVTVPAAGRVFGEYFLSVLAPGCDFGKYFLPDLATGRGLTTPFLSVPTTSAFNPRTSSGI